jgi:KUP system potassium uptake protein
MLGWFVLIGTLGAMEIIQAPAILLALNPWYGIMLFAHHGVAAFFVLGGVVLAVTGAEALYADLGHFGRRPIRLAWFVVVLPALMLNYFGQGALLLRVPAAIENPST